MIESFKKNKKGIYLMLISAVCVCIGQLFWKLSSTQGIIYMLIGFMLYGVGALVMIIAYKYGKLSILQPILSLNYVVSLVLAVVILHENVDIWHIIGIVIIMCGVVLVVGGDKE